MPGGRFVDPGTLGNAIGVEHFADDGPNGFVKDHPSLLGGSGVPGRLV